MKIRIVVRMILLLTGTASVTFGCVSHIPDRTQAGAEAPELTFFDQQPEGEKEQIRDIANKTKLLQDKRLEDPRNLDQIRRGVHAKAHGCVSAKFTINGKLDKQYRVGLFKEPKSFVAKIRFSNAAVLMDHDLEGGNNRSRGMAIKVLDVDGTFLNTDGEKNQDFLMINTSQFAFPTVRAYGFLTDTLLDSPAGANPLKLLALANPAAPRPPSFSEDDRADVQKTLGIIRGEIQTKTVRNPAQIPYFGSAPFLFGANRVMKFSAAPCAAVVQTPFVGLQPQGETPGNLEKDYLRLALKQSMEGDEEICYNFQIQVRNPDEVSPEDIEDASKEWSGEPDMYVNVATITIPLPQDIVSPGAVEACEKLFFSPWHTLEAHQPVGGINRLRRDVYYNSAGHRRISVD